MIDSQDSPPRSPVRADRIGILSHGNEGLTASRATEERVHPSERCGMIRLDTTTPQPLGHRIAQEKGSTMQLAPDQVERFYAIWKPLMLHVNRRLRLVPEMLRPDFV